MLEIILHGPQRWISELENRKALILSTFVTFAALLAFTP